MGVHTLTECPGGGGAGRGSQGVMCRSRLSAAIVAGVLSLINMERVELRRLFLRASYASSRLTSQVPQTSQGPAIANRSPSSISVSLKLTGRAICHPSKRVTPRALRSARASIFGHRNGNIGVPTLGGSPTNSRYRTTAFIVDNNCKTFNFKLVVSLFNRILIVNVLMTAVRQMRSRNQFFSYSFKHTFYFYLI